MKRIVLTAAVSFYLIAPAGAEECDVGHGCTSGPCPDGCYASYGWDTGICYKGCVKEGSAKAKPEIRSMIIKQMPKQDIEKILK